jgi:hypothetical protein
MELVKDSTTELLSELNNLVLKKHLEKNLENKKPFINMCISISQLEAN